MPRHRLVHPHQRVKRDLQILDIGRGVLVEDHQIDGQLLQPPIFMRSQKLADEIQMVVFLDPDQHDGQDRPEIPCAQSVDTLPHAAPDQTSAGGRSVGSE